MNTIINSEFNNIHQYSWIFKIHRNWNGTDIPVESPRLGEKRILNWSSDTRSAGNTRTATRSPQCWDSSTGTNWNRLWNVVVFSISVAWGKEWIAAPNDFGSAEASTSFETERLLLLLLSTPRALAVQQNATHSIQQCQSAGLDIAKIWKQTKDMQLLATLMHCFPNRSQQHGLSSWGFLDVATRPTCQYCF